MLSSNCTIFVPQASNRLTEDNLGNPVPVALPDLQVRAWLHEIKTANTEQQSGVERDYRSVRGFSISSRTKQLTSGSTVKIRFDDGREGTLKMRDRVVAESAMLTQLRGGGTQLEGEFRENTQR